MSQMAFNRLTTMLDCSRNAIMTVEAVKKWIDLTADMGYNTVMLYIEDVYEVNNQPYFGYAKSRYTKEELREIDTYSNSKGMEFIPCIQTLAHLNGLTKWHVYRDIIDCNDILLAGDERVYQLIEDMFDSLSECLTTKHINIGLDEAHMLGRGKYFDLHGMENRHDIFLKHLNRVSEIAKKHGYTLSMWSDMFFRLASAEGKYMYEPDKFNASEEIKDLIPDNVEIVFWEYASKDKERYDSMFYAHHLLSDKVWFACGLWTWNGFAPWNQAAIDSIQVSFPSCERNGIKDIMVTCWQEDTSESARFSVLPSLFFAAEYAQGNKDIDSIKRKFEEKYLIPFDDFMLVDLTSRGRKVNPTKYVFFNDLFNGLYDTIITDKLSTEHKEMSKKLEVMVDNKEWGYIFRTLKALCDVTALKADLGIRIRKAYREKDMDALKVIIGDCRHLVVLMEKFYEEFRIQWYKENKTRGFDVQDFRIGGMIARVKNCTSRLQDYVDRRIDKIEELEEDVLDRYCDTVEYDDGDVRVLSFDQVFTANMLYQPW